MTTISAPGERDQRVRAFERVWSEPRGFIGALRTINNIPMNVVNDLGVILPSGAPVTFSTSGQ